MTLDRKWEKFKGGPHSKSRDAVRITLNRKGTIYFNPKAYQVLGSPKAVALYYSREDDAIALEPSYPRFVEHFQVVKKQNGWAVNAASFCRHYNIRIPNTERFIRPDLTNEGQMILSLKETVTVGGIVKVRRNDPRQ
ncbi:MAG: hypothetical protein ABR535_06660 [Pyrinomonadaceae bacterium]